MIAGGGDPMDVPPLPPASQATARATIACAEIVPL